MVRLEAAQTLGVLEMYPRAAETVVKRLSDLDPTTRAHAVTSLVRNYIRKVVPGYLCIQVQLAHSFTIIFCLLDIV